MTRHTLIPETVEMHPNLQGTKPPASLMPAYWAGGAFLMGSERLSEYRDITAGGDTDVLRRYRKSFAGCTAQGLIVNCLVYVMLSSFILAVFPVKSRTEFVLALPFIAMLFACYLWWSMLPHSLAQFWAGGRLKPNPKGLQILLTRAGAPANEAIVIGDRRDRDVAPVIRIGTKVLLRSSRPTEPFLRSGASTKRSAQAFVRRHVMAPRFERTIDGLINVLVDEVHPAADAFERHEVSRYVLSTVAAMPDYFRLGFRVLGALFEFSSVPLRGRRFTRLQAADRQAHIERWRGSFLSVQRAMIAFYTAFTRHGLYQASYPTHTYRVLAI